MIERPKKGVSFPLRQRGARLVIRLIADMFLPFGAGKIALETRARFLDEIDGVQNMSYDSFRSWESEQCGQRAITLSETDGLYVAGVADVRQNCSVGRIQNQTARMKSPDSKPFAVGAECQRERGVFLQHRD